MLCPGGQGTIVMERAPRKVPVKDGRRSWTAEGRTLGGEPPFWWEIVRTSFLKP